MVHYFFWTEKVLLPVNQIVDLKVFVVVSERVVQGRCHVEPTHVEKELEDEEDGDVEVELLSVLWLEERLQKAIPAHFRGHLHPLAGHQGYGKIEVDSQMDNLQTIIIILFSLPDQLTWV